MTPAAPATVPAEVSEAAAETPVTQVPETKTETSPAPVETAGLEDVTPGDESPVPAGVNLAAAEMPTEAVTAKAEVEQPAAPAPEEEESLLEAAGDLIGESLTDVADTVRAVAEVVGDKLADGINDLLGKDEEE